MLKRSDIKFPITFQSRGIGHYHFISETECMFYSIHGKSDHPMLTVCDLDRMISCHNKYYNAHKDYGYAMPGYTCFHYKPYKGQVLPIEEVHLLDTKKIVYPITIATIGASTVTFTSSNNGVYGNGVKSSYSIDFFVDNHNMYNQENDKNKVYYVYDIERQTGRRAQDQAFNPDAFKSVDEREETASEKMAKEIISKAKRELHDQVFSVQVAIANETKARVDAMNELRETMQQGFATIRKKIGGVEYEGAIENMPVGATIKGIKNGDGEFDEITFTATRVEIYDDVIKLLSGYDGGSMPKLTQTYAAEINIKRGTIVKWKVKA